MNYSANKPQVRYSHIQFQPDFSQNYGTSNFQKTLNGSQASTLSSYPNYNNFHSQSDLKRSNVFTSNVEKASFKHSKSGEGLQSLWLANNNKPSQIEKSNIEYQNSLDKFKPTLNGNNKDFMKSGAEIGGFIGNSKIRKISQQGPLKNNMYTSHIMTSSGSSNTPKVTLEGFGRFTKEVGNIDHHPQQTSVTQNGIGKSVSTEFSTQSNGSKRFTPMIPSEMKKYGSYNDKQGALGSLDSQKHKPHTDFTVPSPSTGQKKIFTGFGNFEKSVTKNPYLKEGETSGGYNMKGSFISDSKPNYLNSYSENKSIGENKTNQYRPIDYKILDFPKGNQSQKNKPESNYSFNQGGYEKNQKTVGMMNPFRKEKVNYQPSVPVIPNEHSNSNNNHTLPPLLPSEKKEYYEILAKKTAERLQSKKLIQSPTKIQNSFLNPPTMPKEPNKLKKGMINLPASQSNYQFKNPLKKFDSRSSEPKKICKEDFVIGKKLGKGKFGQVFLVKHKLTGFVCALKSIPKKLIKQEQVELQFSRQLQIQFFLNHQNITGLYGNFDDSENVYLLLELCSHGQLFNVLKQKRRLSEEQASSILRQICNGVQYMHRQRIIHRDLKPQNIIMQYGVPKICDFGWAVYFGDGLRQTFCGTPLYVSPQILKGQKYDEKIDLWAIGILCYELLVGRIPFKINSESDLSKIISQEIKFPDYIPISEIAKDFVFKILKKKPEDRIQIQEIMNHQFLKEKKELNEFTIDFNNVLL